MVLRGPGSHLDYRVLFDSVFFSFSGPTACQSDAQSDTQAIPLFERYDESTLFPKGFPLVFVRAVMSTASRLHILLIVYY